VGFFLHRPKRNPNLRLTLAKDEYAVGLLIFPKENFCFSLPPPQPAPSAKPLRIPVVIWHRWLLVANPEGREPAAAAASDSRVEKRFVSTGTVAGWV